MIKGLLIILLLSGCAMTQPQLGKEDSYVIYLNFHSTAEIESKCGKNRLGCWRKDNNLHVVHTIRNRCVIAHELDHVFHGAYHGNKSAICSVRAQ